MRRTSICYALSKLINSNADASTRYHQATVALLQIVDSRDHQSFAGAKQNCHDALEECTRTKTAILSHLSEHGCRNAE